MVELQCGSLTLEGFSRSTIETYVKVKELNICFDIGKCPMSLVSVPQVFISHFHGDHSMGLTYYIAHRNLARFEPGKIYIPAATEELTRQLIHNMASLEQARRHYELIPLEPGDSFTFKRNHIMKTFATDHRIPSLGFQVVEERRKLKDEFVGLPQQEIVALKKKGVDIVSPVQIPKITYVGDSTIKVFEWSPEIMDSEILMTECTFLSDEHLEEAQNRKHIHIKELLPYLPHIKSQYIVLMHFSMRYTRGEIHHYVRKLIPPEYQDRILLLI